MKDNIAIQIENLSKHYALKSASHADPFVALDNINLNLTRGSVTGIIGRNGAGKSTLLKILSRITYPTQGRALVKGRLASLLEVGTGFHPELTGRENVFLNGALLGMKRSEIKQQYDEIVDFAGIASFMETPVKHYSSGMYVRLAFSVAAHLSTDVLLIDEVLAVGDTSFQKKCLERTEQARTKEGRTVIFVSHNMSAIRHLCDEVVWLEDGRIKERGDTNATTTNYLSAFNKTAGQTPIAQRTDRLGDGDVVISGLEWSTPGSVLISGQKSQLKITYHSDKLDSISNLSFRLNVFKENGEFLTSLSNEMEGQSLEDLPSSGSIVCEFDALPFLAGEYFITSNVFVSSVRTDQVERALVFSVEAGDRDLTGSMRTARRSGVRTQSRWKQDLP